VIGSRRSGRDARPGVSDAPEQDSVMSDSGDRARRIEGSSPSPGQTHADFGWLLSAAQVQIVSPSALARWSHLLLVEDDTSRSARRGLTGVAERSNQVLVRVHRIGMTGLQVVGERSYSVGAGGTADRAAIALSLLDRHRLRDVAVVSGTAYSSNRRFLDGLYDRNLDAVVEIRPSSGITRRWKDGPKSRIPVASLIDVSTWEAVTVPVAGSASRSILYSVARLGSGYLDSGHYGSFFAIQTGAIRGLHPGTIFGFTQTPRVTSRQLVESVGWARWIRPIVRYAERQSLDQALALTGSAHGSPNGGGPRLRANITLSRAHDMAFARDRRLQDSPKMRGALRSSSRTLNVVELFAGAGGMGLGFLLADSGLGRYRLTYSGEVDPIYVQTLNTNHAHAARILGLDPSLIPAAVDPVDLRLEDSLAHAVDGARQMGEVDVLIGGPPCQGFSSANRNSWTSSNPHNQLVGVFLDYVEALAPKLFMMENVQGIHWTQKSGVSLQGSTVLAHVLTRMKRCGYEVFVQLLDSVWYGVPQCRSRFFVLGILRDLGYTSNDFGIWGPFPQPSHGPGTARPYVKVRDAISDLPPVGNGCDVEVMSYVESTGTGASENDFLDFLRRGAEQGVISDHVTSRHADYVIDRYKRIPEGGNWSSIKDSLTNYANADRTHSNIYRRLTWDEPSITIGHYRKSMLVHPSQDRGLSLREAARLQSFPDWFRFAGNAEGASGGLVHKQQQLANAVCPLVSKGIAEFILEL
jgi:DNA-cytosine methyltransferase